MIDLACSRYAGSRGSFRTILLFLFHFGWKSRVRLPVLIAIGFMVLDIRMQLEINIDLGRGNRQAVPVLNQDIGQPEVIGIEETDTDATYDDDSESYTSTDYSIRTEYNTDSEDDDDQNDSIDQGQINLSEIASNEGITNMLHQNTDGNQPN